VDKTAEYLHRASQVSSNSRQLEIDIAANTMDEVMLNWERVLAQRREMNRSLSELLAKDPPQAPNFHEFNILNLHFNIQYHSFNDKYLQELMQKVYAKNIKGFSRISSRIQMPNAALSTTSQVIISQESQRIRQPIRIGFMSKSFGVFEPHGLLLDGIVKYLPRSVFKVYVLRVMLDNKSSEHMLSPTLEDYADELVDIPVNHKRAGDIVERLQLDIMVFADTLCEPINHYMMFSRYSPIQILFW
jgi:predicted O-linked N-acetylglucosamine transferase (SPINDLY family)